MARRRHRKPPTPQQRRLMIIAGAALVAFACFTVLYEAIVWDSGRPLSVLVVALILFLVFILPIVFTLRGRVTSRQ